MFPGVIIKERRLKNGLTLEELSQKTSFSIGYLSKLERAESMPPLATLQKLADVLDLDMTELLSIDDGVSETADRDIEISRSNTHDFSGSYTTDTLFTSKRNRAIVPTLMRIKPGATDSFEHDAEEFIYVVEGSVDLRYKDSVYHLSRGDGAYIDSRKPHSFVNNGTGDAVIITANYIYRRF